MGHRYFGNSKSLPVSPVEDNLSAEAPVFNSKQGHPKGVRNNYQRFNHQGHVCFVRAVSSCSGNREKYGTVK